ncbi:hypothetical protein M514_00899 [Trichuris suis]|uniref:Uncharacterized protein n=1 Tax=Trichuris suis TaxID=68888 RepID=A0A085MLP0_9BILA|nr:hypothetical protein M513_00899 [Trichuris suis]KFD62399.1 hypothetical protein M514_00899 [Trichuris suis]
MPTGQVPWGSYTHYQSCHSSELRLRIAACHLDFLCAFTSKIVPEKATKPRKARKSVPHSSKLNVINSFDRAERNMGIVSAVNLCGSTTRSIYLQGDKTLKAVEATVRSPSRPQIMDKVENLTLTGPTGVEIVECR